MNSDDDLDDEPRDGQVTVRLGTGWDVNHVTLVDELAPAPFSHAHWGEILSRDQYAFYVADVIRTDCLPKGVDLPPVHDLAGFVVVNLLPDRVCILRLVVLPYYRRSGIGLALLKKAEQRMRGHRMFMRAMVPDTCLDMQMLLKSAGYECQEIYRSPEGNPDRYLFVKRRSKVRYANSFIVYSSEGKVVRDASKSEV